MKIKLTKVTDTYLEPTETSVMKFFCENIERFPQRGSIIDT